MINENENINELRILLNDNLYFSENKTLKLKELLLKSNLKEINIKEFMGLDKKEYPSLNAKRVLYKRILDKCGFKIEKRIIPHLRKRIIRNCLNYIPEFRFKTFWFIILKNDNGKKQ